MGKVDDFYEKFKNDPVLIEMINDGSSLSKMAQYMSLPSGTAGHVLSKMGRKIFRVEVRKPVEWDEFTSYLFGLILADGCVHKPRGSKGIGQIDISSSDYEFLEKIATLLNLRHITHCRKGDYKLNYRICWTDKDWYECLIRYNIKPNKSFEPELLSESLFDSIILKDFIRGFFDGDGSVTVSERKGNKEITIFLFGNNLLLTQILDSLPKEIRDCFGILGNDKRRNDLYKVSCGSLKGTRKFYSYLYDGSTVYMDRKKNLMESFILSKEVV